MDDIHTTLQPGNTLMCATVKYEYDENVYCIFLCLYGLTKYIIPKDNTSEKVPLL